MQNETNRAITLVAALAAALTLGCGPAIDATDTEGSGDGSGVETSTDSDSDDSAADVPTENPAAWALGVFHNPEWLGRQGYLKTYELRPDGTGIVREEGCREGPMGPYDEFAWRMLSDDKIEVYDPLGEPFKWIRSSTSGPLTLTKVADGEVLADDVSTGLFTHYVRGSVCVAERVPMSECREVGFLLEACED